ncbi:MAG: hypothetical protein K2Y05_05710, partial [Hyphomicrobiaceae bacterium]|nr:hypothetical protein [Hyphomicrobiaceae bacterium]
MRPKPWPVSLALTTAVAVVTGFIAVFAFSDTAAAISLTNRDAREHKISVTETNAKSDHVLKPGDVLASVCLKGCIVRLNDSENDEYELEGD